MADLRTTAPNGDKVSVHLSRFHGLVVTASRDYISSGRREVCAYMGDLQALADWLATECGVVAERDKPPGSPATEGEASA